MIKKENTVYNIYDPSCHYVARVRFRNAGSFRPGQEPTPTPSLMPPLWRPFYSNMSSTTITQIPHQTHPESSTLFDLSVAGLSGCPLALPYSTFHNSTSPEKFVLISSSCFYVAKRLHKTNSTHKRYESVSLRSRTIANVIIPVTGFLCISAHHKQLTLFMFK